MSAKLSRAQIERAVIEKSFRQHGVITRAETLSLGMSKSTLSRRVTSGQWEKLYPGVFRVGAVADSFRQTAIAATKWAGESAVLSHRSALQLWGFPTPCDVIEISTPHRRDVRAGLAVHQTRPIPSVDSVVFEGVPVTSPARTILDIATLVDAQLLNDIIDFLVRREVITEKALYALVLDDARSLGCRGRPALRRCLLERIQKTEDLTTAAELLLLRAGIDVPARNQRFIARNGKAYVLPLVFPKLKLAILPFDSETSMRTTNWPEKFARNDALNEAGWSSCSLNVRSLRKRPKVRSSHIESSVRARFLEFGLPVEGLPPVDLLPYLKRLKDAAAAAAA